MSLWRYRHNIGRAVSGDLSGRAELRLRAHLSGCDRCREHYNRLSKLNEVGDTRTAAERQRARLLAALPSQPAVVTPRARRWVWALPVLVPALMALLWAWPDQPDESVAWRGGSEPAAWPLSLVLYEFSHGAKDAPTVLGELPFSRGVRVSRDALVQLAYAKLEKATFVVVVGEQDDKRIVLYPRRPQDEGLLSPEPRAKALGTSLNLHAAFHPGSLRVWLVTSTRPLTQAEGVAATYAGAAAKGNGLQVFVEAVRLLP